MKKKLANLPTLVQGLGSAEPAVQFECCKLIRRLLSVEKNPPIQQVVDCGVVPIFVEFLKRNDFPKLQFEAEWALTNIASGTSEQTRIVVNSGCVPMFVELMKSSDNDVREQAVWALGNIAGDSVECRDLVLSLNALPLILEQFTPTATDGMIRNATWTLSNLCRGKPPFAVVAPCLPYLSRLIYSDDEDVLSDACWALSYLTDSPEENIQAVIESRVCKRLVQLLMHPAVAVVTPALRAVGNIVTGDDVQTQVILNCTALPCLVSLLQHQKRCIRKEAAWTISNITAGNVKQIQDVIDAGVIPTLIGLLGHGESDIKKEACWAISNATCGTVSQVRYLVAQKCIQPLCDMLFFEDPKICVVALEALENILRVGRRDAASTGGVNKYAQEIEEAGGVTKIDQLQRHANQEIYTKASSLIETYFGEEGEAEDTTIAPSTTEGGQFSFHVELPAGTPQLSAAPGAAPAPAAAPAPFFFGGAAPQPQQPGAAPVFGAAPLSGLRLLPRPLVPPPRPSPSTLPPLEGIYFPSFSPPRACDKAPRQSP
eukprot:GAFH01001107.1.p1 GENE.GAFH01001107.1~~GAFH01001107.1.p1  ORF type:complete len:624 (-),score=231.06 GAFH01001107.1:91-1719(-)